MNALSRLQPGMRVRYQGEAWRVELVNECRARLVPARPRRVEIRTAAGVVRRFLAREAGVSVSPNAELEAA